MEDMNHTPQRVTSAQQHVQQMMSLAPQQFEELTISHISRRLDLNDGKLDEIINGKTKHSAKKNSLLKMPSPFHVKKLKSENEREIPVTKLEVNSQTVNAISKLLLSLSNPNDLQAEGIFRKSGNCNRHKELKEKILIDCSLDMTPYNTHDRASVIKYLLADLPEPLLLARHFEAFRQAMEFNKIGTEATHQSCLRVVQLLLLHLPLNNVLILKRLIPLLSTIAQMPANKMDSRALGTLFAPHLLCSKRLQSDPAVFNNALGTATDAVTFMIDNGTKIFQIPPEFHLDVVQFLKSEKRLSDVPSEPHTPLKNPSESEFSPVSSSLTFSARSREFENTTEQELAKLQAHIQTLPENEKQKFTKQLNRAAMLAKSIDSSPSVHDTPGKYHDTPRKHSRSKSLSSSIRKKLPRFGNKNKHQTPTVSDVGSFKLVNIDFEEKSDSGATVVSCSPKPSKSSNPAHHLSPHNGRRRHSDGDQDPTPPKMRNLDGERAGSLLASTPAGNEKFTDTILPLSENEREFLHVSETPKKLLMFDPVHRLSPLPSPPCMRGSSPQKRHSRSRENHHPQSAQRRPISVESSV